MQFAIGLLYFTQITILFLNRLYIMVLAYSFQYLLANLIRNTCKTKTFSVKILIKIL